MRELLYRCLEIRVWPGPGGIAWEVSLLIRGKLRVLRGTVGKREDLGNAVQSRIAAVYQETVGSPLPDTAR